MIIYLVGFMGSGKSTAGKKLAAALRYRFVDLDNMIEEETGLSIAAIFREKGEESFRISEMEILRMAGRLKDTVISCGGGTPCFHDNMEFMNSTGLTIYLEMTPVQLKSRLSSATSKRPLVESLEGDELMKYITDTLADREHYYLRSKIVIDGFSLDTAGLTKLVQEHQSP